MEGIYSHADELIYSYDMDIQPQVLIGNGI